MNIKEFLDSEPTLTQILEYIESEAQKIARDRQKQTVSGRGGE